MAYVSVASHVTIEGNRTLNVIPTAKNNACGRIMANIKLVWLILSNTAR